MTFRTYGDDLTVLNEFSPSTEFDLSPGEKKEILAGDWHDPQKVHVRCFKDSKSNAELTIDEWFAIDSSRSKLEDGTGTAPLSRIDAPI